MSKRFLSFFMGLLAVTAGCGDDIKPETSRQTPPVLKDVTVETAAVKAYPLPYEAVGTVRAGATVELAGKLMGVVERVMVREGDAVKAGDVLVLIDPRHAEAGYRQAEANLLEAEKALDAAVSARDAAMASRRLAQATYDRYLHLKKEDSVSAQEFDEVEARFRQSGAAARRAEAMVEGAAARIRQAKAGLASAAVTRKDAVVTAPSDGVITAKFVEEGALASPGMPLLGMDTLHGYRVDAVLPETYFGEVRPGLQVSVKVPASGAGPLRGTIRTIVPAADPRSRSFVLKVTLEEEPPVTSGMFARVEVPIGRAAAILIPPEAVVRKGQLTGLFVLGDGEIARFRLVRLGRMVQGGVEVLSGLEKGERFASPADPRLKDGVRVETKP